MLDVDKTVNGGNLQLSNLAYLRHALAALWKDYARIGCERSSAQHELATSRARVDHLEALLARDNILEPETSRAKIAMLEQSVADCQRQIARLHSSTSWRVTAPLRSIVLLLRR